MPVWVWGEVQEMLPENFAASYFAKLGKRVERSEAKSLERPASVVTIPYLVKPWDHQLVAIDRATPRDHFGLFFEMGAGKTMTAINILRKWYVSEKRLLRTLVLGPPIVVQNWRREFAMHSKVQDHVVCLEGAGKKRLETFGKAIALGPRVFVTNYESLLMAQLFQALIDWAP